MTLLGTVEHETAESELSLLIREARRRQRRRRLRVTVTALALLGATAAALATVGGATSSTTRVRPAPRLSATGAARSCPSSVARYVSNATFSATVLGSGPVRLGVGNVYAHRGRRIAVYHDKPGLWGGIEALWFVRPGVHEPLTVRGFALFNHSPIEVQPGGTGTAPGRGPLSLAGPSEAAPVPAGPAKVYAGSLWLRGGGCYAIDISGRGISERLVFDAAMRTSR